jgi:ankyrin repeat protein
MEIKISKEDIEFLNHLRIRSEHVNRIEYEKVIKECNKQKCFLGEYLIKFLREQYGTYHFYFFQNIIQQALQRGTLTDINFNMDGYGIAHALLMGVKNTDIKSAISWILNIKMNRNLNYLDYNEHQGDYQNIKKQFNGQNISSGTILHITLANEDFYFNDQFNGLIKYYSAKLLLDGFVNEGKKSFDWNSQDIEGKTVLLMACKMRATEIVQRLCKLTDFDIDVNLPDMYGNTPLHYACALGDVTSFGALIEFGANINIKNKQQKTPKDFLDLKQQEVEEILKSISINPNRNMGALNNELKDVKRWALIISLTGEKNKIIQEYKGLYSREKQDKTEKLFYELQLNLLGEKSLLEICMKGRKLIETLLKKSTLTISKQNFI